jgi:ribosomal protein S8
VKRSTHIFLSSFIAAHRASKPYVVVRSSKAALQLCALLRTYGLIRDFRFYEGARAAAVKAARRRGKLPPLGKRAPFGATLRVGARYRAQYLLVDLTTPLSTPERSSFTGGIRGSRRGSPSGRSATLELLRAPSRRTALRLSCAELRTRCPHRNVLYLLETTRGVVSSEEALRFGLGGTLIALIRL